MSMLHLIFRNLLRRKVRTIFTALSILVAFVLFAYLSAIGMAFSLGVDVAGQDRLLTIHKVSLIQPLPVSHVGRVRATPGVLDATHATWFGGKYQDFPEGRFGIFPVDPEEWLRMYPEYRLSDAQREAWMINRTGAVVGRKTADDFGWEIGDRVPIQGTIFRLKDGGDFWEFEIEGIYEGSEPGVDETLFFLHYDYFNEAHDMPDRDMVGWLVVRVADPEESGAVAGSIDSSFANSPYETETMAEKAFVQSFANQIGNIGGILRWVMTAVFFTILLIAGNTMAQSVRERTSELAVLKTLGFSNGAMLGMVLFESMAIAGLAGVLGLTAGWLAVAGGDPTGGYLPLFRFASRDVAIGAGLAFGLGITAGILPAIRAMRLQIVDALRRA